MKEIRNITIKQLEDIVISVRKYQKEQVNYAEYLNVDLIEHIPLSHKAPSIPTESYEVTKLEFKLDSSLGDFILINACLKFDK